MIPVKLKLDPLVAKPEYATKGSAGFDIAAAEDEIILPGETKLIRTGLYFAIPEGYELQIRPRSGTSLKTKIRLANAPGTVDSDYRGEVKLIIENSATEFPGKKYNDLNADNVIYIKHGDRLCQGVIAEVEQAHFILVDELDDTERGSGGFGHTGTSYNASKLIN